MQVETLAQAERFVKAELCGSHASAETEWGLLLPRVRGPESDY